MLQFLRSISYILTVHFGLKTKNKNNLYIPSHASARVMDKEPIPTYLLWNNAVAPTPMQWQHPAEEYWLLEASLENMFPSPRVRPFALWVNLILLIQVCMGPGGLGSGFSGCHCCWTYPFLGPIHPTSHPAASPFRPHTLFHPVPLLLLGALICGCRHPCSITAWMFTMSKGSQKAHYHNKTGICILQCNSRVELVCKAEVQCTLTWV